MALGVNDPEIDRLARELAAQTGETLTEAILNALRERLDREKKVERPNDLVVVLREARARIARLPVYDDRSADEILGYGDHGLPGEKWDSEREQ